MEKIVITTRGKLDELWLPWCIDASTFDRTTWDHKPPAGHPHAAQLRLTDLRTPAVERALETQPVESGSGWSWSNIAYWLRTYEEQAERGESVVVDGTPGARPPDQPVFMYYGAVPVLREGCHRTSALWLSGVEDFELRRMQAPADWSVCPDETDAR